ncbi:MAG: tRNA (guanine(10)-N(2))-dimethyltransferase, partial [Methanoregulaceae archaeon]|nr:tRNA (guanine(10)-N(2))-dimethyltransferase [Methanoregulaceae archaeon]
AMKVAMAERTLGTREELVGLIDTCRAELPTSSHYDYHRQAKVLRVSPPRIADLIARLQEFGFEAGRTHYSGTSLKTDAPLEEIYRAITG